MTSWEWKGSKKQKQMVVFDSRGGVKKPGEIWALCNFADWLPGMQAIMKMYIFTSYLTFLLLWIPHFRCMVYQAWMLISQNACVMFKSSVSKFPFFFFFSFFSFHLIYRLLIFFRQRWLLNLGMKRNKK